MFYLARRDSGGSADSWLTAPRAGSLVRGSPPWTQPPLAAWPGLSALPPRRSLPPMVLRLGLLFRRALGLRRRLAPGDRLSRRGVPAPRALRVREHPLRVPRAVKGRLLAPLTSPT